MANNNDTDTMITMDTLSTLFRELYCDRFDPTLEQLTLALQIALCLAITTPIAYHFKFAEILWTCLPTAFIALCNQGISYRRRILTMLIATAVMSIGIGVASIIGQWVWAYILLCFIVAGVGFYFSQLGPPILTACVSSVVLISIAGFKHTTPDLALSRSGDVVLGGLIALLVTSVVFRYQPKKRLAQRLRLSTRQLKQLCDATLLSSICGAPQAYYRDQLRAYALTNLQSCRKLLDEYPNPYQLQAWRIIFSLYNSLNALWLLLNQPGVDSSFNSLSRYLVHINQILSSCFMHLNNDKYHSSLKKLCDIELQLSQQVTNRNEDFASLAFLIERFRQRLEEYHDLAAST